MAGGLWWVGKGCGEVHDAVRSGSYTGIYVGLCKRGRKERQR